jgi:hypothetical protein
VGLSLLLSLLAQPGWAYFGGNGTLQVPYLIATPEDLVALSQNTADYDKHFLLLNDIDLAGYIFDQAVIAPSQDSPFRAMHEGDAFFGTINGNGYVI